MLLLNLVHHANDTRQHVFTVIKIKKNICLTVIRYRIMLRHLTFNINERAKINIRYRSILTFIRLIKKKTTWCVGTGRPFGDLFFIYIYTFNKHV